jgi:hypothetical protein
MVVIEQGHPLYGVVKITEPEAIRLADLIPHNFVVSRSLARTLSLYVDRRRGLSWTRRFEIARPLAEPLRTMFNFPPQTNPDLLLAAVYYRAFNAPADTGPGRRSAAVPPVAAPQPAAVPLWNSPEPATQSTTARFSEIENYLDRIS